MEKSKSTNYLLKRLASSKVYQTYERAFIEATGLPLTLRPVEVWNEALHGKPCENPFCALMAQHNKTCVACLETQHRISRIDTHQPQTTVCFAGLCDSTVPIRCGENIIGFLQTGQIAFKRPSRENFKKLIQQLEEWGIKIDRKTLESTYFQSKVLPQERYQAVLTLLESFASYLSSVANQIAIQEDHHDPAIITKAKDFIHTHKFENISLSDVAKAVNMSLFYFCKIFKKSTGINFTEYLSRVRIEASKELLLDSQLRIGEIAYDVGFQSLTHFNRVFRKIVGQSPTAYRQSLPKALK